MHGASATSAFAARSGRSRKIDAIGFPDALALVEFPATATVVLVATLIFAALGIVICALRMRGELRWNRLKESMSSQLSQISDSEMEEILTRAL